MQRRDDKYYDDKYYEMPFHIYDNNYDDKNYDDKYYKMPFHFYDGACNSFTSQTKVLLCFSSDTLPSVKGCHM